MFTTDTHSSEQQPASGNRSRQIQIDFSFKSINNVEYNEDSEVEILFPHQISVNALPAPTPDVTRLEFTKGCVEEVKSVQILDPSSVLTPVGSSTFGLAIGSGEFTTSGQMTFKIDNSGNIQQLRSGEALRYLLEVRANLMEVPVSEQEPGDENLHPATLVASEGTKMVEIVIYGVDGLGTQCQLQQMMEQSAPVA